MAQLTPAFPPFPFPRNMQKVSRFPIYHTHNHTHPDRADGMMGFDNGILIAFGMCPPCPLQEFYQLAPEHQPTHFMRGTAAEIWGTDTHEVMRTTAADWDTEDMTTTAADCWDFDD